MSIEFYFTPELHLKDGRIIRDFEDAASFAREHELRPGIDQRDEGLHKLERAESQEDCPCCSTLLRAMGGGTRPSGLAARSFVEPLAENRPVEFSTPFGSVTKSRHANDFAAEPPSRAAV